MKLLFDQNLSPRLMQRLADLYPGSEHVSRISLDYAAVAAVWDYARDNGYTIVTKDVDLSDMSILLGFPPRILWLRLGNCSTQMIETALRLDHDAVLALNTDPESGVLALT